MYNHQHFARAANFYANVAGDAAAKAIDALNIDYEKIQNAANQDADRRFAREEELYLQEIEAEIEDKKA